MGSMVKLVPRRIEGIVRRQAYPASVRPFLNTPTVMFVSSPMASLTTSSPSATISGSLMPSMWEVTTRANFSGR